MIKKIQTLEIQREANAMTNQKALWLMSSPSRVDELPSPPYVLIKNEDDNNKISNNNINFNIKDNIFQIKSLHWRAGSKKQDLNALGGIIMAWHLGFYELAEFLSVSKVLENSKKVLRSDLKVFRSKLQHNTFGE